MSDDEAPFELTTELIMLRAIERGLTLRDFNDLTTGMVLGLIVTYNNERLTDGEMEDATRQATQVDFDKF